jgi:putative DNA primase/helicase
MTDDNAIVLNPHDPKDYMTKMTSISPNAECPIPIWLAFLDRVTAEDKELQAYLQRVSGYCLTGITREHAMFFLYGTGGNGKGVFVNVLASILGDYHCAAPIETFTESNTDKHPTELARLQGARLVTSTETEANRNWAEARIKMLTGGDPVSARFMRQDFFDYIPQFKLMIMGNHKPGLRSVDEAIRRRLHLIPFTVTIPHEERDTELGNKLIAEYPGILAWMIQGCREWKIIGLAPPEAVKEATANYLESEDKMKLWIDDCCNLGPNYWTENRLLFRCYKEWCEASGERVLSMRKFSDDLDAAGFKRAKRSSQGGRGFLGLTIYRDEAGQQQIWKGKNPSEDRPRHEEKFQDI